MTYLVLASILLTVLFVGTVIWRRWRSTDVSGGFPERLNEAIPDSISALVYDLPRRRQWLWIVWMWAVSLLTCIPLIETMPDDWRILAFATLACLMLCGAMPISDSNVNHRAHNAFGTLGGILSQACVAITSPWWLLAWLLFVAVYGYDLLISKNGRIYPSRWYDGKGVFLAEMICAVTVSGSLLTRLAVTSAA